MWSRPAAAWIIASSRVVIQALTDGRLTVADLQEVLNAHVGWAWRGAEGALQIQLPPGGRLSNESKKWYLRYVRSTVEIIPPQRDPNGRWLRGGRSPNAGGVSQEKRELIDLARERSPAALDKIFAIMNDEMVPPAVQLAAAGMILDRGYGKPRQMIETGDRGSTLEEILRAMWAEREAEQAQEPGESKQAG